MAERTVVIGSAGKTFSCTGWKIGWVCGPAEFVAAVRTVKQFLTFVSGGPFQYAVAAALALPDAYFAGLATDLRAKRDALCDGLEAVGLDVFRPAATYFVTADVRSLGFDDGVEFCRRLPEWCGVVAIPVSVFYDDPHVGRSLVRFACCKRPDVIAEAVDRLSTLRERIDGVAGVDEVAEVQK